MSSSIWIKPKRPRKSPLAILLVGRQPGAGLRQSGRSLGAAVLIAASLVHNSTGAMFATVTHGNFTITIPQNRL